MRPHKARHISMSLVTYECVMAHMDESWHTGAVGCTNELCHT